MEKFWPKFKRKLMIRLINDLRLSFGLSHLLTKKQRKGYVKLHCVAIYLATGRRATCDQRRFI